MWAGIYFCAVLTPFGSVLRYQTSSRKIRYRETATHIEDKHLQLTASTADTLLQPEETDEALMLAYQAGDAAAFDRLYRRHKDALFRFLLRSANDRAVAEEVFQDVWMNLVRARKSYRPTARFSTYLYQVAHNRLVDVWRRQRPLDELSDDLPADTPGPEHIAIGQDASRHLLTLIAALPAEQREAVLLHEERGLSLDEIASVTGAGRETIKSRLRYALDKLRRGMSDA
jgi:RNA polymerase sigma-70 factor (ECF subfamily)